MKISLITGAYKRADELNRFFKKLDSQTSKNFELIITIDTNINNTLSVISKWEKSLGTNLKVIYNTKRQGRAHGMYNALNWATSKYAMFISISDKFDKNFVENITNDLEGSNEDIIEIRPFFKGIFKWDLPLRIVCEKPTIISERPEIIAKTMPTHTNKIFRTSLAKKVKLPVAWTEINSRLAIEWLFILFAKANTFKTLNKVYFTSIITEKTASFNPLIIIRQWPIIMEYYTYENLGYSQELAYNSYFHSAIFLMKIAIGTKNKIIIKKLATRVNKQIEEKYSAAFTTNKYLLQSNDEAKYLSIKKTILEHEKLVKDYK